MAAATTDNATEIGRLKEELQELKSEKKDLKEQLRTCATEERNEIYSWIAAKEPLIAQTIDRLNLLEGQTAGGDGIALKPLFEQKKRYFIEVHLRAGERDGFKAQAILDTGSDYPLILPRRKVAQLGLRCLGRGESVNGGNERLFPYEPVIVSIPELDKVAPLPVFGVSEELVAAAKTERGSTSSSKSLMKTPKKQENETVGSSGGGSSSDAAPAAAAADAASSSFDSPVQKMQTRSGAAAANELALSPFENKGGRDIDSDLILGRPALESLSLDLDFKKNVLRVVTKSMRA